MERCTLIILLWIISSFSYAQTRTSVASGPWTTPATWDCICIPATTENVIIANTHVVTTTANTTINDLTINTGGTLTNNNRIDVNGNYVNNGIQSGTGRSRLRGVGTTIDGTGAINNTNNFVLRDGNKTILATANLTLARNIQLGANVVVTNNGRMTTARALAGNNANRTWTQGVNSYLSTERNIGNNMTFNASANGNEVEFARTGTNNQRVKTPVSGLYYDLTISGTSTNSVKSLRGNTTVTNDLIIGTSRFDVSNSNHNLNVQHDWINNTGDFRARNGVVTFNGTGAQSISHPTTETFNDVNIRGTGTKLLDANIDLRGSLDITSTLDVNSTSDYSINLEDDWSNTGTFLHQEGLVTFDGNTDSDISGTNSFYDITADKTGSGDVIVVSETQSIINVLDIDGGDFDTNDDVILVSNAAGTASLFDITGGTITGSITMQRFLNISADEFIEMTSPVQGTVLNHWEQTGLGMSGFTCSDYPNFSWVSVYSYDENNANGVKNDGWTEASTCTEATGPAAGYRVYVGTGTYTPAVTGDPYTGTQTYALDYQNILPAEIAAATDQKGWNLIGNPYPSNIDWDNLAVGDRTNIDDAIWIWSGDNGNYGLYVGGSGGVGTNDVDNIIASSQSFWVHGTAASPGLTLNENDKVRIDSPFVKTFTGSDLVKVRLTGDVNSYQDEALFRMHHLASKDFDAGLDYDKLYSPIATAPNVCFEAGVVDLSMNSIPAGRSFTIPLKVLVGASGNYTLDFTNVAALSHSCVVLEDLHEQQSIDLMQQSSYEFYISDTTTTARFVLHIGLSIEVEKRHVSCNGAIDGEIVAIGKSAGIWNYEWKDATGTVLQSAVAVPSDTLSGLSAGIYTVAIKNKGVCSGRERTIEIEEPSSIQISSVVMNTQTGQDGSIHLQIMGGKPGYTILWDNGATTATISGLSVGDYWVTVTDANGCIHQELFTVNASLTNGIGSESQETSKVNVYPNPNNGNFSISLQQIDSEVRTIRITDVQGKIVWEKNGGINSESEVEINLPHVEKGMYIIQLITSNQVEVKKVFIE
jgi:hypothetical protein